MLLLQCVHSEYLWCFSYLFYLFFFHSSFTGKILSCLFVLCLNSYSLCGNGSLVTKSFLILLRPHGMQPTRLLCPWDFPGKTTGVGCHFFLQGIFLTQGLNLRPLHCRWILYWLSHQGSLYFTVSPFVISNSVSSLQIGMK